MSFPPYPKYKKSGVAWLGDVPEHWDLHRLGFQFSERREKVSDKEYPPLSVTKRGILPQLDTAAKTDDNDNRKRVCKGDFVINSRSDRNGSAGVSELDGSVSLINTVLRPHQTIHGPFVHHLLRSQPFQEEFYRFGKGIVADLWSTNYSEMRNILLAVPPLCEQETIASFLSHESVQIGTLIAEQQRLIALLQEKRQAVISHAVTKGLNPDIPTKPSGVERLGDVPAHWQVCPLSLLSTILAGFAFDANLFGYDGIPVVRMSDIGSGVVHTAGAKCVSADQIPAGALARAGDFLIGLSGSIGSFAVVREADLPIAVNQRVAIVRPRTTDEPFLSWFLRSDEFCWQLTANLPSTTIQNASMGQLRGCRVPLPPNDERTEISQCLARKVDTITRTLAETERAIDLLQERRAAVISAAATGKIDVRAFVSSAAA